MTPLSRYATTRVPPRLSRSIVADTGKAYPQDNIQISQPINYASFSNIKFHNTLKTIDIIQTRQKDAHWSLDHESRSSRNSAIKVCVNLRVLHSISEVALNKVQYNKTSAHRWTFTRRFLFGTLRNTLRESNSITCSCYQFSGEFLNRWNRLSHRQQSTSNSMP